MNIVKKTLMLFVAVFFSITLQANDKALQNIQNKLNSLKSGVLVFNQQDSQGSQEQGIILFSKPGKARIEYAQSPITIIANSSSLVIYNKENETKSYIPSSKVPIISILAKKNLDFKSDNFVIRDFVEDDDKYNIVLSTQDKNLGFLLLSFDKKTLNILSWQFKSGDLSQTIKVDILNQIDNKSIPNNVFNVNRITNISVKDYSK